MMEKFYSLGGWAFPAEGLLKYRSVRLTVPFSPNVTTRVSAKGFSLNFEFKNVMKFFRAIWILIHDHAILMISLHENQHVFLVASVSIHALFQASSIVASVPSCGRKAFPPTKVIVS